MGKFSSLMDIIEKRKSIRSYKPQDVSEEDLNYVLEAFRKAPSAKNLQPWKLIVVKDRKKINDLEKAGYGKLPVIIAKTQFSLSDDRTLISRPRGFKIFVRDIILKGGAEFVVAVAGNINLMPGLPKCPAAECINISDTGDICGLF